MYILQLIVHLPRPSRKNHQRNRHHIPKAKRRTQQRRSPKNPGIPRKAVARCQGADGQRHAPLQQLP